MNEDQKNQVVELLDNPLLGKPLQSSNFLTPIDTVEFQEITEDDTNVDFGQLEVPELQGQNPEEVKGENGENGEMLIQDERELGDDNSEVEGKEWCDL